MGSTKDDLIIKGNIDIQKNLQTNGSGYVFGNLEVKGNIGSNKLGLGTNTPAGTIQIINKVQDANGNSLIIGPTNQSNLRLGYHNNYSWIQSHGGKPLIINPLGLTTNNPVGIGTTAPKSPLHVAGTIESSKGGFKFPNGSIQNRASEATRIMSGSVRMNETGSWKTSPLLKDGPQSKRSKTINLSGFTSTPHIMWSISKIDSDDERNLRLQIKVAKVTKATLQFEFHKWSNTRIYHCDIKWLAIGK